MNKYLAFQIKMKKQTINDTDAKDEGSVTGESDKKGSLLMDATACPQDIAYPTDLNLLNDAREKSEELIDLLYDIGIHLKKPRTYRQVARKFYLQTAQKKTKTNKELRTTWVFRKESESHRKTFGQLFLYSFGSLAIQIFIGYPNLV